MRLTQGVFFTPFYGGLTPPTFVHHPLALSPSNPLHSSQEVFNVAYTVLSLSVTHQTPALNSTVDNPSYQLQVL